MVDVGLQQLAFQEKFEGGSFTNASHFIFKKNNNNWFYIVHKSFIQKQVPCSVVDFGSLYSHTLDLRGHWQLHRCYIKLQELSLKRSKWWFFHVISTHVFHLFFSQKVPRLPLPKRYPKKSAPRTWFLGALSILLPVPVAIALNRFQFVQRSPTFIVKFRDTNDLC